MMNVIMERYPYRYVEDGVIELNGKPDYRIQKLMNTHEDIMICIFVIMLCS